MQSSIESKIRKSFTGKEFDDDGMDESGEGGMGLYYFGKRYLDPEIGRWISTDPSEQYFDSYAYTTNGFNPITAIDPDGGSATLAGSVVPGVGNVIGFAIDVATIAYFVYSMYQDYKAIQKAKNRKESTQNLKDEGKENTTTKMAKGGKQKISDSGLQGLSDAELEAMANSSDPKERARARKEQKARKLRNKQKRQNKCKNKGKKGKKGKKGNKGSKTGIKGVDKSKDESNTKSNNSKESKDNDIK